MTLNARCIQLESHLLLMREPSTMRESSISPMISEASSPLSSKFPRVLKPAKLKLCTAQSALTCFSLLSISFSLTALMQISCKTEIVTKLERNNHRFFHTSMSSLNFRIGASMMFLSWKDSDSTSKVWLVTSSILFQCLSNMALFDIISSNGQLSLKSSIFFFNSLKACHSLRALGSLRHLESQIPNTTYIYLKLMFTCSGSPSIRC